MSDPKKHHWIPQFLLERFTTGKKRQMFVLDKHTDRSWRASIRDIASENGFYTFDFQAAPMTFEPSLAELEGKVAPIIARLLEQESLRAPDDGERALLAFFIMVQMVRTPDFEAQLDDLGEILAASLDEFGGSIPGLEAFKSRTKADRKLAHAGLLATLPQDLTPHLMAKSWCLLRTSVRHPFLIGDAPVTMQNLRDHGPRGKLGLRREGIEVYFPLSKTMTLAMMCPTLEAELRTQVRRAEWRVARSPGVAPVYADPITYARTYLDGFNHGLPIQIGPENVANLNSLQILHANRFVYAPTNDFALARDMIREDDACRTGRRMQRAR